MAHHNIYNGEMRTYTTHLMDAVLLYNNTSSYILCDNIQFSMELSMRLHINSTLNYVVNEVNAKA